MTMGRKVAELNTLSDGKGITGIRFFNEMEYTNESTNLRKIADVWMSTNRCCQGHRNRSTVSVTRITVDIGHPSQEEEEEIHIVSGAKFAAKCPFSPNSTVTKPSKSSSESESSVHCCRAAVKTRRNSKEWSPKLDQIERILPDMRLGKPLTCAEIICDHCHKRPRMQASSFYVYMTEYGGWRWRSEMAVFVEAV